MCNDSRPINVFTMMSHNESMFNFQYTTMINIRQIHNSHLARIKYSILHKIWKQVCFTLFCCVKWLFLRDSRNVFTHVWQVWSTGTGLTLGDLGDNNWYLTNTCTAKMTKRDPPAYILGYTIYLTSVHYITSQTPYMRHDNSRCPIRFASCKLI